MKKWYQQIILLALFIIFLLSGCLMVKYALNLPFRATNDALHKNDAFINLDFLIPSCTHINEQMTIREVLEIRVGQKATPFEKMLLAFSQLFPSKYRYLADLFLFFFWSFVFMTFIRVFTFMGYGRAIRVSLLLGGISYYFMPDFSVGRFDDIVFIILPILIIVLRAYLRQKKKRKIFVSENRFPATR
ncbi:MAG: hypothetical protein JW932_11910 [Deltaproteobacteria bacterium]|nr:hypothetical protein [Deltaproteobacteria bacterium]